MFLRKAPRATLPKPTTIIFDYNALRPTRRRSFYLAVPPMFPDEMSMSQSITIGIQSREDRTQPLLRQPPPCAFGMEERVEDGSTLGCGDAMHGRSAGKADGRRADQRSRQRNPDCWRTVTIMSMIRRPRCASIGFRRTKRGP